jgi:hypothetical protein
MSGARLPTGGKAAQPHERGAGTVVAFAERVAPSETIRVYLPLPALVVLLAACGEPAGDAAALGPSAALVCEQDELARCLARDPSPIPALQPGSLCAEAAGAPLDPAPTRIYLPEDRSCDPQYAAVALGGSDEGVLIEGPTIDLPACVGGEARLGSAPAGFEVRFGDRLLYQVAIQDFEDELTLTRAQLYRRGDQLASRFYFAVTGGGRLNISIQALLDGKEVRPQTGGPFYVMGGRRRDQQPCAERSSGLAPSNVSYQPWCPTSRGPTSTPLLIAGRDTFTVVTSATSALGENFACGADTAITLVPVPAAGATVTEHDLQVDGKLIARVRIEGDVPGALVLRRAQLYRRFAFTDVDIDLAALRPGRVTVTTTSIGPDGGPSYSSTETIEIHR